MCTDTCGQAPVVGHDSVESAGAGQTQRCRKMDGVEGGHCGRREGFRGRQQSVVQGEKRDPGQELIRLSQASLPKSEAAKLDSQQAAGHPLVEGAR